MNAEQKDQFVRSLCDSVRNTVLSRIQYMPEGWDGIELREYLALQFERECTLSRCPPRNSPSDRKRLRSFKNVVATTFGL